MHTTTINAINAPLIRPTRLVDDTQIFLLHFNTIESFHNYIIRYYQ